MERYIVWSGLSDGWWPDEFQSHLDAMEFQEACSAAGYETRIIPSPTMTAEAWVREDEV